MSKKMFKNNKSKWVKISEGLPDKESVVVIRNGPYAYLCLGSELVKWKETGDLPIASLGTKEGEAPSAFSMEIDWEWKVVC